MRRVFIEIEDGVVVDIHNAEVRGNKGNQAKEPRNPINKRKPQNEVKANGQANKGDKIIDGKLYRPLTKRLP